MLIALVGGGALIVYAEYANMDGVVKLSNGGLFKVIDNTASKAEMAFSGISLKYSDIQKIKENTQISYDGEALIAQDIKQAAKIGGDILNLYYTDWTETRTIVVTENKNANT